ncbi:MAG: TetR/AcrR family transcriptional regulator [Mangrovimonas sp.]|nr:TetR/AcrR family transcriptional regulator [Mangrovimonas sp.]MCB0438436.1 TetR/AcrR family transcriptional regulator [Mangrovimonas sp.]HRV54375.1 TetR/AcrR family transcriptional regulator [Mangrovimonas sp.]
MSKKKKITENEIIDFYMQYVLNHGEKPKSVYFFAKENHFEEGEFYLHFSSFEALEKEIFHHFGKHTLDTLNKSEDYSKFDTKNKLLSFYFTFFENLTANRSYVVYSINQHSNKLKNLKTLSKLKTCFTDYISSLNFDMMDTKIENIEKFKSKILVETAWIQLMLTMEFWLKDTSKGFEKTDIFIEKSVNTSFDLIQAAPLKSLVDFGKFLYKEKIHTP